MQNDINIWSNTPTLLDDITKNIYESRKLDFQRPQNDLFDVLNAKSKQVSLNSEGMYVTFIQDSWGSSVVPGGRNTTLADGDYSLDMMKIAVGIKQYYANAELTAHDMDFEGNGGGTIQNINVVSDSLDKMLEDIKWARSCWAFGNGTGQLATVSVGSGDTSQTLTVGTDVTIKCGNSYLDLGIDGAKFLMKGKLLDIYGSDGVTYKGTVLVTSIKRFRVRGAGTDYFIGKVIKQTTTASTLANNDKIFGKGWNERDANGNRVRDDIMMGIRNIINPALPEINAFGVDATAVFQNLQRGAEFTPIRTIARNTPDAEIYRSQLWRSNAAGTDIAAVDSSNYSTFNGSTLIDWDLGTIREILENVDFDSKNSGKVDTLFMNSAMANMFFKVSKDKITITETEAQAESTAERGFDVKRAKQFIREDGTVVTFHISNWMMNNEIMGLCSGDLFMLNGPAAHFLNRNGGTWEPTYANNKDNFQAPYKGFGNFGAYRCDKCFWIQGLKDINN